MGVLEIFSLLLETNDSNNMINKIVSFFKRLKMMSGKHIKT